MLDSLDESDDLEDDQTEEQEEKISLKLLDKEIQTLGKFIEQAEALEKMPSPSPCLVP